MDVVSANHAYPWQRIPPTPPKHESNRPPIKVRIPYMPPSPYSAEKLKHQAKTTSAPKVVATPPPQTITKSPMPARRLIPMIPIPLAELKEDFDHLDHVAWHRKLYGPNIIVVAVTDVPEGWVLVDGMTQWRGFRLIALDYGPQPMEKIKKRWNPFDRTDPNWRANRKRAQNGLPPVDVWNVGVEYEWDGMCFASFLY